MENEDSSQLLDADTIEEQLARILASPQFANSERLSSFLEYVVRKTLAARSEDIKEYAVATEVFERPESFDPRLDTIVRVQAGKLRSRLTEYYAQSPQDKVTIELPRGSYVPVFHLNGNPKMDKPAERVRTFTKPAQDKPKQSKLRSWLVSLLALAAVVLALRFAYTLYVADSASPQPLMRFEVPSPDGTDFFGSPQISGDGRHLACNVQTADGNTALWMRALDTASGEVLPATKGGSLIGWSANGRLCLFCTPTKVAAIDVGRSDVPQQVPAQCSFGMDWNQDGVILEGFHGYAITRVSAANGAKWTVTHLNPSREEIGHYWPQFLPDNKHFLYFARSRNNSENAIYVGSLDHSQPKRLVKSDSLARYAPVSHDAFAPGYLLYVRDRTLVAQTFDPKRLEIYGDPHPISHDVAQAPYGFASFSVSKTGILVYVSDPGSDAQLTWFNREGLALGKLGSPGKYDDPILSPDGKRVAFNLDLGANREIGVMDVVSGELTRLTLTRKLTTDPCGHRTARESPSIRIAAAQETFM